MTMVEISVPRLLVVDDDAAVLVTFDYLLQRYGYAVTAVSTGAEALALILQDDFDLLLIDLALPNLIGIDLVWYAAEHQPNAAVLILADDPEDGGTPREEQVAPFGYIVKTSSVRDVLECVAAALAHPCRPMLERSVSAGDPAPGRG